MARNPENLSHPVDVSWTGSYDRDIQSLKIYI